VPARKGGGGGGGAGAGGGIWRSPRGEGGPPASGLGIRAGEGGRVAKGKERERVGESGGGGEVGVSPGSRVGMSPGRDDVGVPTKRVSL